MKNVIVKVQILLAFLISALLISRFVYINADFPINIIKVFSGAIYTDEGWYASNAVNYLVLGDWYLAGDFNPAVNLPIFTIIQVFFFKIFGVSISSARALTVIFSILITYLVYIFVKRHKTKTIALLTVFFLSVNFFFFAFSRLAFLELPMTFFILLSIFLLDVYCENNKKKYIIFSGIAYITALLIKTTAIFAAPILLYIFLIIMKGPLREKIRNGVFFVLTISTVAFIYVFFIVMPYYGDYQYFSSLNITSRLTFDIKIIARGMRQAIEYGIVHYREYLLLIIITPILFLRNMIRKQDILSMTAIAWIVLYLSLIGINNYAPHRYYVPFVVPIAILSSVVIDYVLSKRSSIITKGVFLLVAINYLFVNVDDYIENFSNLNFSFEQATEHLQQDIAKNNLEGEAIILTHGATSLGVATESVIINTTKGTKSLQEKLNAYEVNYFVQLGQFEEVAEEIKAAIEKDYDISFIGTYDVFNNFYIDRGVSIYKLNKKRNKLEE
jgi:4-amino-4-deoxy-L-arabinose transferase-like glycosyltransferase